MLKDNNILFMNENKYVTANIVGGLGNQLFIIFNTFAYSFRTRRRVFFKNYTCTRRIDNKGTRTMCFDSFLKDLKKLIINNIEGDTITHGENRKSVPLYNNKIVKFSGYFQSLIYFKDYSDKIIEYLNLKSHKGETRNSISMHFRIGDYKAASHFHHIQDYEYYYNSLKFILNKTNINNWNVEYCCEDEDIKIVIDIVNKLSEKLPKLNFKRIDDKLPDWKQLFIMSDCKHNIIANSTFSWWSAYFNNNSSKIVCYPKKWFGNKYQHRLDKSMFPEEWNCI